MNGKLDNYFLIKFRILFFCWVEGIGKLKLKCLKRIYYIEIFIFFFVENKVLGFLEISMEYVYLVEDYFLKCL